MNKIKVPEGMRLAAGSAFRAIDPEGFIVYPALEVALQWLSEELDKCIKPEPVNAYYSPESIAAYDRRAGFNNGIRAAQALFLAPQEKEMDGIADILKQIPETCHSTIKAVKEAYRRGKEGK